MNVGAMTTVLRGPFQDASQRLLAFAFSHTGSEFGCVGMFFEQNKLRVLARQDSGCYSDPDDGESHVVATDIDLVEVGDGNELTASLLQGNAIILSTQKRLSPDFGKLFRTRTSIRNFLGIPIINGDSVVGMIALANRIGDYTKDIRETVESLAQVVGMLYHCCCVRGIETELVLKQQQTEDALLESERKLSTLIANLPGIAFRCRNDKDWTMEFVSNGCRQLTGYDSEDLIHSNELSYNQLIYPDDQKLVWDSIQTALSKQQFFQLEYRIVTKTGAVKWVLEHGVGVFSKENRLLALEGFIIDNTGRKRVDEELISHRAFLRHIIDINPNFVFAKDREGRFTLANQAVAEAYGTTIDDLIGKKDADFNPNIDEVKSFRKADLEVMNTMKDKFIREEKLTDAAGNVRWLQTVKRALFDHEYQPIQVLGVATDITERKRIEAALENERASLAKRVEEKTAELKTANRELARTAHQKDEFLATMSHELRTPLNAILGLTDILQQEIHGPLTEKQRRSVQMLENSGRHLLDLINDILDVAKIGAGKIKLTMSRVSVNSVCEASLQFINQAATQKDIAVVVNIDPSADFIYADERRLKQILVNLLTNAVKFTPEKGSIGLDVVGDAGLKQLKFTIWDSGIGISTNVIDRLFLPFTQVDSSFTRAHEGTGLGLSLVLRLTEMHGGEVGVESKEGEGSRFTIILPWQQDEVVGLSEDRSCDTAEQENYETEKLSIPKSSERPITILLAEDNEESIAIVREYLKFNDYGVIEARNGVEALERAAEAHPDLILMDIHMPKMDGLEATRRLRLDGNFAKTPIIALTALAMPGDRELSLEAGADAYISKPVKLKELARTIEKTLAKKQMNSH